MKRYRNLTADEIVAQVEFAISHAGGADPTKAKEFKINYTRMGEPFLNIEAVKEAIRIITERYPNTHHYVSTIGIKDSDFSFIKDNITLQISLHSFDDDKRNWLIPEAAMMLKGNVAITFNVHKDGRITDITVLRPSGTDSFDRAAANALAWSNPTQPLPPEYPSPTAFFTVTFFYNEQPPSQ